MLAVDDPENDPALHALAAYSRSLYPGFLARIEQLAGAAVPLRTSITLQGHAGAEPSLLAELLPGLRTDRYRFERLEEASLDPRDLCAALPAAVRAAGVNLIEGVGVERVTREGGKLRVAIGSDPLYADHFVLAAGAWSAQVTLPRDGEGPPALPVAPRKGQMIEVTLDGVELPVVVRTPLLYLVPRGDGRVAVGATVEHAEFDRSIDAAAGDRLWQAAGELWPPLLQGRITARWTGLRPGFRAGLTDTLPVIGHVSDHLWAATGHFRNGILLAPATARMLREIMDGAPPSVPLDRFTPARFA